MDKIKIEEKSHKSLKSRKHKKNKKHKKRSRSSSEEVEWVETSVTKPKVQREDWMTKNKFSSDEDVPNKMKTSNLDQSLGREEDEWIPTLSREDIMCGSSRQKKKEAEMQRKSQEEEMLKSRELNPHWKDNGSGVPDAQPSAESLRLPSTSVGDGGVGVLRKAHQRVLERASEEGRSKEDVAAERYGSYKKLLSMMEEAESRRKSNLKSRYVNDGKESHKQDRQRYKRPDYDRSPSDSSDRTFHYKKPKDAEENKGNVNKFSSKERSRDRGHSSYYKKYLSSDEEELERKPSWGKKHSSERHERSQKSSRPSWKKTNPPLVEDVAKSEVQTKPSFKKAETFEREDSPDKEHKQAKRKESTETEKQDFVLHPEDSQGSPVTVEQDVSDEDANMKAAREMRNRLMGNLSLGIKKTEPAEKPTEKGRERVMLTKVDSSGQMRPIVHSGEAQGFKVQTNKKSKNKYFDDGSSYSLKNMFEREKLTTTADNIEMFMDVAAQCDDMNEENETSGISKKALNKMSNRAQEDKDYGRAIHQHQKQTAAKEKCDLCLENSNVKRHLLITLNDQAYLSIPNYQSLVEGHCLIIPKRHVKSFLALEEDEWQEIEDMKKSLRLMFRGVEKSVLFLETSMNFHRFPHAVLECIPVPAEDGDMAPMYFKKAIEESEAEWANNIKLVHLKKGLRNSVPKNLPYFCVLFDPEVHSGYAHVIEDEKCFPRNFGKEIIGGMLDIDYNMLYKNRKEDPIKKASEALEFTKLWKKFKDESA